jgi:hypothetical protein
MVQHVRKSKVKIVPRDGELEITLNINISLDGQVVAMADNAAVSVQEEDEAVPTFIPDFSSGKKLNFGKKE